MIARPLVLILNGPHDILINIKVRRHELGWQVKRRQQREGVHGIILIGPLRRSRGLRPGEETADLD
jgi:hypothetical protein